MGIKKNICYILSTAFMLYVSTVDEPVYAQQKTYCNPINIDYGYTPIPNFSRMGEAPGYSRSGDCKL